MTMISFSDEELIMNYLKGSEESFELLYDRYKANALTWARKVSFDLDEQADILQLIFLKVFLSLSSFRFECRFSSWFFTICRTEAFQWRRRKLNIKEDKEIDFDCRIFSETQERELIAKQELQSVNCTFQKMSKKNRQAVILFLIEGHRIVDVSKRSGLTEAKLKSRLHRARLLLAKSYQNSEDFDEVVNY